MKSVTKLAASLFVISVMATPALAQGDPKKGEKVWKKCKACHTIEEGGKKKVGPNLFGIVEGKIAAKDGYKYSKNLAKMGADGGMWTEENLQKWLKNPKKFSKGAKMGLKLKKEKDRDNIIALMKTYMKKQ